MKSLFLFLYITGIEEKLKPDKKIKQRNTRNQNKHTEETRAAANVL